MRSYIDVRLRPDPEVAEHQLMSAMFGRLHLALVQVGRQDIGVSFPEHNESRPTLGVIHEHWTAVNQNGELVMTSEGDTVNHILRPGESAPNTVRVLVRRLDDLLAGVVPALVKVDVEG